VTIERTTPGMKVSPKPYLKSPAKWGPGRCTSPLTSAPTAAPGTTGRNRADLRPVGLRLVGLHPVGLHPVGGRPGAADPAPGLVLIQGHFAEGVFDVFAGGDQFLYRVGHSIEFKKCDA
jgi:hypothetical protein